MSAIPVTKGSGEVPNVEPGVYKVTLTRQKDDFIDNAQFGDGNIVRLYFQSDDWEDDDGEPIELDAIANAKVSPKAKLTRWAEALGRPIDFDSESEFDPEELVGSQCLAKVVRKDAESWPKIEDLTALPKSRTQKAATKPQEARQASPIAGPEDDDAQALSDWWSETRRHGFKRTDVVEMSKALFDGKEPADLEPPGRAHLLEQLLVGL